MSNFKHIRVSETLKHIRLRIAMCEWQIGSCKDALPKLRSSRTIKIVKAVIRETSKELRGLRLDEAAAIAGGMKK